MKTIHEQILEIAESGNVYAKAFLANTTLVLSDNWWHHIYSYRPESQFDPSAEFKFEISERKDGGFIYWMTIWENGHPYDPPFVSGHRDLVTIARVVMDFVNQTNNILGFVGAKKWEIE